MVFMGDGYTAGEIGTTYTAADPRPFGLYVQWKPPERTLRALQELLQHSLHRCGLRINPERTIRRMGISRDTALDASYSGRALNVSLSKADEIEESGITLCRLLLRNALHSGEQRGLMEVQVTIPGIYSAGNVLGP